MATRQPHQHHHYTAELGVRIRQLRIRAGYSQDRLAGEAGMGMSFLSRLESGDRAPSRASLEALCDTLPMDREERRWLFHLAGYSLATDATAERLAALLDDADARLSALSRATLRRSVNDLIDIALITDGHQIPRNSGEEVLSA